jgi:hypothetical protein
MQRDTIQQKGGIQAAAVIYDVQNNATHMFKLTSVKKTLGTK